MPTRKPSEKKEEKNETIQEEAKWQLEVLQTYLESRPITFESLMNVFFLLIVFSLGGVTSSLVSGGSLVVFTTFLMLLALSCGLAGRTSGIR